MNTTNLVLISQWFWAALAAYWVYTSRDTKSTRVGERLAPRVFHRALILSGFALLVEGDRLPPPLTDRIFSADIGLLGAAVTVIGIGFAIWARAILEIDGCATPFIRESLAGPWGRRWWSIRFEVLSGSH